MKRSYSVLVLLVSGSLLFAACKKSEDPTPVPLPTGAASPTPVPNEAPPAAVSAAAVAVAPPVTAPLNVQPLDACCSALAGVAKSGRGADAKSKAALASKICSGIAPLVKAGKTSRASALSTIKSQMVGAELPAECH